MLQRLFKRLLFSCLTNFMPKKTKRVVLLKLVC